MLDQIALLLRGSVRVRAESPFPERVLNLCSARGIAFRDPVFLRPDALCFTVSRRDWRRLRAVSGDLDAELRAERAAGLPFALGRLKRRRALAAGLVLCVAALLANACFIWDLRVEGNVNVPAERVLRVLADNGLRRGAFVRAFDQRMLSDRALLDLPELCWLTVNIHGCRATAIVRERVPKPEIVNESAPTNVVARRDALVTDVRALDGEARVLRGSTVRAGQLLISGVVETGGVETPTVRSRFLAGKGEVWGRTWYELSVSVPMCAELRRPAGKPIRRFAVLWGENRVKIGGKNSGNLWASYDKMVNRVRWTLPGDFVLPVTWVTETLTPMETLRADRSREEAQALGRALLENHLRRLIGEDGELVSSRCAAAMRGDRLLVTLSAECREQIGVTVPIPMDEVPGKG